MLAGGDFRRVSAPGENTTARPLTYPRPTKPNRPPHSPTEGAQNGAGVTHPAAVCSPSWHTPSAPGGKKRVKGARVLAGRGQSPGTSAEVTPPDIDRNIRGEKGRTRYHNDETINERARAGTARKICEVNTGEPGGSRAPLRHPPTMTANYFKARGVSMSPAR